MTELRGRGTPAAQVVAPDVTATALADLWSLAGRRAVVTGAAGGIGEAIAARLVEAGADVIVADIDVQGAAAAVDRLGGRPGRGSALARHVDVSDADSVARLARECAEQLGGLDVWVNNAGVFPSGRLLELDEADWDHVVDVNLKGTWLGCREAARRMTPRPNGSVQGVIINIEAMAAYRGRVNISHYVASKHGVVGLTRGLAAELGPQGIRVVGIAPTFTETPGVARRRASAVPDEDGADGVGFDAARPLALEQKLRSTAPLGRNAVADDVARAALFLASDMAALTTGSTVFVDAGAMAP